MYRSFLADSKNILYYSLVSITAILLLDKVKFLNKEDIFDKIRNIKFGDVEELFSSIYSNISSIPGALNLIYTTYKQKIHQLIKTLTLHVKITL